MHTQRRGHHHGFGPGRRGGAFGRGGRYERARAAILLLLAEGPRNGHQIIQEVEERSGGAWKPSPGAVYPALQQLADEGLIRGEESEGRKTFALTDEGRAHVAAHPPEAPWTGPMGRRGDLAGAWKETARLGSALVQVLQTGSPAQIAEARRLVDDTRRRLHGLLADSTR